MTEPQSPLAYWQERFGTPDGLEHHRQQNRVIASDFIDLVTGELTGVGYRHFRNALESDRILEVGCGTGEFCGRIAAHYKPKVLVGTDFSPAAIAAARRRYPFLDFRVWDALLGQPLAQGFDLALCSNTLEHFQDYGAVIDRLLAFCDMVLALVPYRQPCTDTYEREGGAGHAVTFTKKSFSRWEMVESALFETAGWTYSSKGEKPRQLAVLLREK